ncbi:hypothetical protein [Nocardia lasii]|uniref:Uncharacterized protein n=1 Tax=Nocardia lasii TaxID=1616107 RepID=A0ABW1JK41_9NOCA
MIAESDADSVRVYRSPVVQDTDPLFQPVRDRVRDLGLVLAISEEFEDSEWMFGKVIVEVYALPGERGSILSAEPRSEVFDPCGFCQHFHDVDTPHQVTEPDTCSECFGLHRT